MLKGMIPKVTPRPVMADCQVSMRISNAISTTICTKCPQSLMTPILYAQKKVEIPHGCLSSSLHRARGPYYAVTLVLRIGPTLCNSPTLCSSPTLRSNSKLCNRVWGYCKSASDAKGHIQSSGHFLTMQGRKAGRYLSRLSLLGFALPNDIAI